MQIAFTPRYSQLKEFRKYQNQLENNLIDPSDKKIISLNPSQFDIKDKDSHHHTMILDHVNFTSFKKRQRFNKKKEGDRRKGVLLPLQNKDFMKMDLKKNIEKPYVEKKVSLGMTSEIDLRKLAMEAGLGEEYLGTFGSNELNQLQIQPVIIYTDDDVGFIVNYAKRGGASGGTHWVALVRVNSKWHYFDPFGIEPLDIVAQFLANIGISKFLHNTLQVQEIETALCGYYCIYFLSVLLVGNETYSDLLTKLDWDNLETNTLLMQQEYS